MANVNGKWKTVIEASMGDQEGVLTMESSGNSLAGTYESGGNTVGLEDGKVDGNAVSWNMTISIPSTMTIECKATVSGDSLSGTATPGSFDGWPLSGTRE